MSQVYTALIFPLILLIGQAMVALGQRKLTQQMDERQAKTDEERKRRSEWRDGVDKRLDAQDAKIATILKGQTTQMRSDIIHRAHRYIDDLGCASVDEKAAFWDEYKDYCMACEAYNITNSFVDNIARQVMELPDRQLGE